MLQQQFDIFFNGQIMDGYDLIAVKTQAGKLFNLDGKKLERLFADTPTCIKAGVDAATASKYRQRFRNIGALVEIKPAAIEEEVKPAPEAVSESPPESLPEATQEGDDMSLMPANSGSLIDCATEVTPQPIPNTDELTLSEAGAVMDEQTPPPPATIDTDELSLNPANSGSLIDCATEAAPQPIPNIDELALSEAGAVIDESTPPPPAVIDTDELNLNPANSGSLEEFQRQQEAVDINQLDLNEIEEHRDK